MIFKKLSWFAFLLGTFTIGSLIAISCTWYNPYAPAPNPKPIPPGPSQILLLKNDANSKNEEIKSIYKDLNDLVQEQADIPPDEFDALFNLTKSSIYNNSALISDDVYQILLLQNGGNLRVNNEVHRQGLLVLYLEQNWFNLELPLLNKYGDKEQVQQVQNKLSIATKNYNDLLPEPD